jgi:hypothetical protein
VNAAAGHFVVADDRDALHGPAERLGDDGVASFVVRGGALAHVCAFFSHHLQVASSCTGVASLIS